MADFDLKSIKGAELQTLATEIAKVILSDGSVLAQALASVDKRVDAVERASAEIGNAGLGERGLVPLLTSTTSESENCAATPKSVKTVYDSLNASKQNKLSTAQQSAVDSGITAAKTTSYGSHIADSNIHVTSAQKESWDAKAEVNGYYPDMSVGGSDHSEVSDAVKDYNDSSSMIKIGFRGASLDECTYVAAYGQVNGETVIKDILPSKLSVGHSDASGKSETSESSAFASIARNAATVNNTDSEVPVYEALPRFKYAYGSRKLLSSLRETSLMDAFEILIDEAGLLFVTANIENIPSDRVLSFRLHKLSEPGTAGDLYLETAVFVKAGNSTVTIVMPYAHLASESGARYLRLYANSTEGTGVYCTASIFRVYGSNKLFG